MRFWFVRFDFICLGFNQFYWNHILYAGILKECRLETVESHRQRKGIKRIKWLYGSFWWRPSLFVSLNSWVLLRWCLTLVGRFLPRPHRLSAKILPLHVVHVSSVFLLGFSVSIFVLAKLMPPRLSSSKYFFCGNTWPERFCQKLLLNTLSFYHFTDTGFPVTGLPWLGLSFPELGFLDWVWISLI